MQQSYALGDVTARSEKASVDQALVAGGLIGYNEETGIEDSHAAGDVRVTAMNPADSVKLTYDAGGLQGRGNPTVGEQNALQRVYATGSVRVEIAGTSQSAEVFAGAFAGRTGNPLSLAYSVGDVTVTSQTGADYTATVVVGGLVGAFVGQASSTDVTAVYGTGSLSVSGASSVTTGGLFGTVSKINLADGVCNSGSHSSCVGTVQSGTATDAAATTQSSQLPEDFSSVDWAPQQWHWPLLKGVTGQCCGSNGGAGYCSLGATDAELKEVGCLE